MAAVEFCFACWPGGPVIPPPCLRCGSRIGYYTSGLCNRCHKDGDPGVDSCRECQAWGATRHHNWLCRACVTWCQNYPAVKPCTVCAQPRHVGFWGREVCRLCYRQASMLRLPDEKLDLTGANRHGQQLFIADTFQDGRAKRRLEPEPVAQPLSEFAVTGDHEQLVLFRIRRDLAAHGRAGLHLRADPARAAALDKLAHDMAAELGWTPRLLEGTCYGLRIVLGIQDRPNAPINASDVTLLRDIDLPIWPVMKVLAMGGDLVEDRTPALDRWFTQQIDGLPETMITELTLWYEIMKNGSPTPPRRRPRSETTIKLHLRWALPMLRVWAAAGHNSLREITREHVLDALPPSGNARSTAGQGLKSICRLLKARKVLFTDPTTRVKIGYHEAKQPLPVNVELLRAALMPDDPARAALVALVAFHGLRAGQLQRLQLTDVRDGRLHVEGRVIILAEPVRERLRAYLDIRQHRWPDTANAHLFLTKHTGRRTEECSKRWIWLTIGPDLSIAAIREDRILDEALATGGDVRRLADLFGLSIQAGTRYTSVLSHPDLDGNDQF
ncbi:hypothetical protein [Micromonospora sp. NPDC049171]|uniref:hypothetical protein n=1 Tax=Micromonospora sp. NPDC049171 TaxID=3155770 RepID=UPI0033CBBC7E